MRQEKKEEWTHIINDWKQSGLNQTQYCEKNNIKRDLFSYYKCQLIQKENNVTSTKQSAFAQVVISPSKQSSTSLQVTLPNGAVISGIQSQNLALVTALMATHS